MPGFRDIYGNALIKDRFKREIADGRLSHAYVLSGEKGIGKKTLAEALTLSLFCDRRDPETGDACLSCPSCKKVLTHNHPDVIYLSRAKESSIGVEEIRRQVVDTVDVRPFYHGRKVYIIPDAELMTAGAQNALLKTLEEPPEYAIILLLANDETRLIDTVMSRAALIRLRPVPDEEIERMLREDFHAGAEEAGTIAAFSRGNIGRARELLGLGTFTAWRDTLEGLMRGLGHMSQLELRARLKTLSEQCPDITEALDYMELLYRDALLRGGADRDAIFSSIDMIEDTRNKLYAHANQDVALVLLFSRIKEI